jgi:hypothetical protein
MATSSACIATFTRLRHFSTEPLFSASANFFCATFAAFIALAAAALPFRALILSAAEIILLLFMPATTARAVQLLGSREGTTHPKWTKWDEHDTKKAA